MGEKRRNMTTIQIARLMSVDNSRISLSGNFSQHCSAVLMSLAISSCLDSQYVHTTRYYLSSKLVVTLLGARQCSQHGCYVASLNVFRPKQSVVDLDILFD